MPKYKAPKRFNLALPKMTDTKQIPPMNLVRYEKVKDFYDEKLVVSAPASQMQGFYTKDRNAFVEQRFDANSAISAMFTTETTIIQKLNMGVCQNLDKLFLRFNVTVSSASAELAPVPYWFKRIEIYNAQQSKIQVIHPEEIMFKLNQIEKEHARNAWKELAHFGDSGVSWRSPSSVGQMASGETRDFYLPLMSVLDQSNLNFRYIKDWVEFRLVSRNDIRESGSGTVGVNSIHFVIQERNLSNATDAYYQTKIANSLKRHNYLDCYRYSYVTNVALTSGTEHTVSLSSIPPCFSPFMLIALRQSSTIDDSAASQACQKYIPIGPAGKIMLRYGSNNIMEISGGVNVDLLYRALSQQYAHGDWLQRQPLYLMNFADSIDGPLNGRFTHGYFKFDGSSNNNLVIQPVAGTSTVHTITSANTAAPDSSFYKLLYQGHATSSLAFDATPATIKAALEALPSFKAEGLTVTVTQAFSTAGTLVITFGAHCNPKGLVTMIAESVNDGGVSAQPVSTISRGSPGIVTSQTHVVDIFVFYYKELYSSQGVLVDKKVYDQ